MSNYKQGKLISLVKEFESIKGTYKYQINGIDTEKAVFFWRSPQQMFDNIPLGSYRIEESGIDKYLVILDTEKFDNEIERIQIGYEFVSISSEYEVDFNVDINILKDNYNKAVEDIKNLYMYIKNNMMTADALDVSVILPQLNTDEVWVKTENGYKGISLTDAEGIIKEVIRQYTDEMKKVLDNYVENPLKPRLDAYVEKTNKPELDRYVEETNKPALDDYTTQLEERLQAMIDQAVADKGLMPQGSDWFEISLGNWLVTDLFNKNYTNYPPQLNSSDNAGVVKKDITDGGNSQVIRYYTTTGKMFFAVRVNEVWSEWQELGGQTDTMQFTQANHGFIFTAVTLDGATRKWVKANKYTSADGIAIKIDNDRFDVVTRGVVNIPTSARDDKGEPFVYDEYYFLSQEVDGGFSRTKNEIGTFQYLAHISEIDNKQVAYIDIGDSYDLDYEVVDTETADRVGIGTYKTTLRTADTIENLKRLNLKVGDVVEVLGYYTKGDGANHKRKIESEDDGSGVQLSNGLWANISNGTHHTKWWGLKADSVTDETILLNKAMNYGDRLIIDAGVYYVTENSLELLDNFGLMAKDDIIIDCMQGATIKLEEQCDVHHIFAFGLRNDKTMSNNIVVYNLTIDCNNSFSNGVGGSNCSNITLFNTKVLNCKGVSYVAKGFSTQKPYDKQKGGGRAVTFQGKCNNISIETCRFINCDIGLDLTGFSYKNDKDANGIVANNIIAENCGIVIEIDGNSPQGLEDEIENLDVSGVIVTNISFKNCGKSTPYRVNCCMEKVNGGVSNEFPFASLGRVGTSYDNENWRLIEYDDGLSEYIVGNNYNVGDKIKYIDDGTNSSIFAFGNSSGITISNVRGRNDSDYGKIGSLFRGVGKGINISDVSVIVDTECIYRFGAVPFLNITTRGYAIAQMINLNNIKNLGATSVVFKADNPIKNLSSLTTTCPLKFIANQIGVVKTKLTKLVGNEFQNVNNSKRNYVEIYDVINGGKVCGNLDLLSKIENFSLDGESNFNSNVINNYTIVPTENRAIRFSANDSTILNEIYVYDEYAEFKNGFRGGAGVWNDKNLFRIGSYRFWLDSEGRLRQVAGRNPQSDIDGVIVGSEYVTATSLDTPFFREKMLEDGKTTLTDYYSYLDEKLAYEKQLQDEEKIKQEAYQQALITNPNLTYEEFIISYPSMITIIEEPTIPQSVQEFMKKYL